MSDGYWRAFRAAQQFLFALVAAACLATAVDAAGMRVITQEPPEPPPTVHKHTHHHSHGAPRPSAPPIVPPVVDQPPRARDDAEDAAVVQRHQENLQVERRIADAAERVAAATDLLIRWAVVQIVLGVVGGIALLALFWMNARATRAAEGATKALQESVLSARETVLATQQPLLKVRHFAHVAGSADERGDLQAMQGSFSIINAGTAKAVVKRSRVSFKILDEPLPIPNGDDGHDFVGTRTLEAGESERFKIACAAYAPPVEDQSPGGVLRSLCIYGSIEYTDASGRAHTTAFCRRYDVKSRRYRAVDDAEWEYSE